MVISPNFYKKSTFYLKKFADSKILCTFVGSFIGVGFINAVVAQW